MKISWLKIISCRRQTSWIFASTAEELNAEPPRATFQLVVERYLYTRLVDLKSSAHTFLARCLVSKSINLWKV